MKAFPVTKFNSHRVGHDGMDLRDYFAAKAMAALINIQTDSNPFSLADTAYTMADAMLEARNK